MKATAVEPAYVRARGFYVTEKRDGCGKLLIQTVRYTIRGRPEVYCSAACRDSASLETRMRPRSMRVPVVVHTAVHT